MAINLQPPLPLEIEVSLFGPGTGECIVLHLGNDDWMVIDSCLDNNRRPVALSYLDALGVSYERVKVVLISHFHDDHIKGINEVVSSCSSARVCISSALVAEESLAFVNAYAQMDMLADSGKSSTHELYGLLNVLEASSRQVEWVCENSIVFRQHGVIVSALSPSHSAVSQSRLDFAREFEAAGIEYRRLAKALNPNLCAVALHVCNGTDTVLLGSDLEVSDSEFLGWEAVLSSHTRPTTLAGVFKVPHHGSHNGHHDSVVSDMLADRPISIVTTMNTHHLPLPRDLERIKAFSSAVYHTTQPRQKPPKRDRAVEEMMAKVSRSRVVIPRVVGHIQLRMLGGVINIGLNEHANCAA
jgi:beta-lactamase superfamily II metal-dependent hydrolase